MTDRKSELEIIQAILTNQLKAEDIKSILAGFDRSDRNQYLLSINSIFSHVAALLGVSNKLLENLLFLMVEITTDLIGADRGTLFLYDGDNEEVYSRVAQGKEIEEIRFPANLGIVGTVLHSGKPILIDDAYADARFNQEIDRITGFRTQSILCAPIRSAHEQKIVGALELLNKKNGRFSTEDLGVLEKISEQAGIALENAQTFEQAQQAHEHESHLLQVSAAISSELQLKPLLEKIMDAVRMILGSDRTTLFLHDEKTNELWSQVATGLQDQEIRFPAHMGIAGQSFSEKTTVNIPDAYRDPRFNQAFDKKTGFRTRNILCMPVINREGKAIGVTQVLNKKGGAFSRQDERKLRAFSSQASIAIENAKLFNEVLNMKNYNESILQSLSNGVISVNATRRIEKCNAIALKTFGVQCEQIIGKYADLFFTGENHWIVDSLRRVIATNDPDVFIDAEVVRKTGDPVSINMTIAPLRDNSETAVGGLLVIEDLSNEKRLKGTLARYMTKEVADQLMESDAALGGQMQEVAVLFSDIRNFTTISETLGPQETVQMLNEYFTTMVDIVFHHGGILDKFIGDAMLGVFGAPFSTGEDSDRAVTTAVEMFRALKGFNENRVRQRLDPIAIGVGINTDKVLVGNIGSMKRMDYTVIGDGVNLASRLEGANKYYATDILISEQTFTKLKYRYRTREVDLLRVKGKNHPVKVFEVLDHHDISTFPNLDKVVETFATGLKAYRSRRWEEALRHFESCLALHPKDNLPKLYIVRCAHFQKDPPPPEWDGVWTLTTKS